MLFNLPRELRFLIYRKSRFLHARDLVRQRFKSRLGRRILLHIAPNKYLLISYIKNEYAIVNESKIILNLLILGEQVNITLMFYTTFYEDNHICPGVASICYLSTY